jgi:hypothetical protein
MVLEIVGNSGGDYGGPNERQKGKRSTQPAVLVIESRIACLLECRKDASGRDVVHSVSDNQGVPWVA